MLTPSEQEAIRFGEHLRTAREAAGVSQKWLAQAMGISDKTISRWENGQTLPDIIQARTYMACLGISPLRSSLGYANPSVYENMSSTGAKRKALADYFLSAASDAEADAMAFLIFWEHGSAWPAMLQMYLADAQVPLLERIGVASLISANYKEAASHGRIVFPSQPQPDVDILDRATEACRSAVAEGLDNYQRFLWTGGAKNGL